MKLWELKNSEKTKLIKKNATFDPALCIFRATDLGNIYKVKCCMNSFKMFLYKKPKTAAFEIGAAH